MLLHLAHPTRKSELHFELELALLENDTDTAFFDARGFGGKIAFNPTQDRLANESSSPV